MNRTLAFSIAAALSLCMADVADAATKRRAKNANTAQKACTFNQCYDKCVSQMGGRNAGGRPAISCSRECAADCPR